MKDAIEKLKQDYTILKDQSKMAIKYVNNKEDTIKIEAGVVTLEMIIEDLQKILINNQ